jgi:hypothetical protein
VGFELTVPAYKRSKTVHASDRSAIVAVVVVGKVNEYEKSMLQKIRTRWKKIKKLLKER